MANNGARTAAYTTIEAAAAIVVLILLASLGAASVLVAARSFEKLGRESRDTVLFLHTESALARDIARIELPLWAESVKPFAWNSALTLPYVGGNRDREISLEFQNGYVVIRMAGESETFGPFEDARFRPQVSRDGRTIGIATELRLGGRSIRMVSDFSAAPIVAGD